MRQGWILWLGLAVAWFCTTQLYPLFEPDEGRYAEIPREMAASGDWVTPRLADLKYFEKPPLQYWATAALYKVFGVNEWTARAWPLALSFLCIPLMFVWTRRLYGPSAAAAALGALAASPFFVLVGHLNVLDGALTFWLTATVFSFTLAQCAPAGSRGERNWMLGAWLTAALAVLSKGIVVPVLAALTLVAYCIVQRDFSNWRRLHIALGLPLFLAVTAPWFIVVSLRNPEFAGFFFVHEHFARFLTTVHRRAEPCWYFVPFAALAVLPWLIDLRRAIDRAWRQPPGPEGFRPLRFLLIYAAVVLIFFSLSQSKLPPYILPMVPPLGAVLGIYLAERPGALRRAAWIAAGIVVLASGGLVVYALRRYDAAPLQPIAWGAVAIGAAMTAALNIGERHTILRNSAVLAAGSMLAWQCLMVAYGSPPSAKSARTLLHTVHPYVQADTPLYSVRQYRQSVPPYLQRIPQLVGFVGELEFGLQQEPQRNSITLDQFKDRWAEHTEAVAFIEPKTWRALEEEGFPGRVIASDRYSTVVSRQ